MWLSSPRHLSVVNLLFYLSRMVVKGFFNSPDGVDFLPKGLAKTVPLRTAALVQSIEPRHDGVTADAVQCLCGAGYLRENSVERMMRDAKALQIMVGTNEIQRLAISRYLATAETSGEPPRCGVFE
jgi:hypothetical protein